jgi:hypothetical protein
MCPLSLSLTHTVMRCRLKLGSVLHPPLFVSDTRHVAAALIKLLDMDTFSLPALSLDSHHIPQKCFPPAGHETNNTASASTTALQQCSGGSAYHGNNTRGSDIGKHIKWSRGFNCCTSEAISPALMRSLLRDMKLLPNIAPSTTNSSTNANAGVSALGVDDVGGSWGKEKVEAEKCAKPVYTTTSEEEVSEDNMFSNHTMFVDIAEVRHRLTQCSDALRMPYHN